MQAGPDVQVLGNVQSRPCAAAKATVEGAYDQQQRDSTGACGVHIHTFTAGAGRGHRTVHHAHT